MSRPLLFVGGPLDGHWVSLTEGQERHGFHVVLTPDDLATRVGDGERMQRAGEVIYRPVTMADEQGLHTVMMPQTNTMGHVLQQLLAGYAGAWKTLGDAPLNTPGYVWSPERPHRLDHFGEVYTYKSGGRTLRRITSNAHEGVNFTHWRPYPAPPQER